MIRNFNTPLIIALEFTITATLSFFIGMTIVDLFPGHNMIGVLWITISAIIVLQESRQSTKLAALIRLRGSLIGCMVPIIFLSVLPASYISMLLIIFTSVFITEKTHHSSETRTAALSASVVIAISYIDPAIPYYINGAMRFVEASVGACLAIFVRYIVILSRIYVRKFSKKI